MRHLAGVCIDELRFLKDQVLAFILLGKFEIRLQFSDQALISVYSRIYYFENGVGEQQTLEAEGEKYRIECTNVLEEKLYEISYEQPNLLVLRFESDSLLKIPVDEDPYESFLINGPNGRLFVFKSAK